MVTHSLAAMSDNPSLLDLLVPRELRSYDPLRRLVAQLSVAGFCILRIPSSSLLVYKSQAARWAATVCPELRKTRRLTTLETTPETSAIATVSAVHPDRYAYAEAPPPRGARTGHRYQRIKRTYIMAGRSLIMQIGA